MNRFKFCKVIRTEKLVDDFTADECKGLMEQTGIMTNAVSIAILINATADRTPLRLRNKISKHLFKWWLLSELRLTINGSVDPYVRAVCKYQYKLLYENKLAEEMQVKEVKRKAEVGEYIKLVHCDYAFNDVGDILKVDQAELPHVVDVYGRNMPNQEKYTGYEFNPDYSWSYCESEYVVLENYKPEENV